MAAGVILNSSKTSVLLSFRPAQSEQGSLWEYPGGKVEAGENPVDALERELEEELDITPDLASPLSVVNHDYGDKIVELHFFIVESFTGTPCSREGQLIQWCAVDEISALDFPEANKPVAAQLQQWLRSRNLDG